MNKNQEIAILKNLIFRLVKQHELTNQEKRQIDEVLNTI